MNNFLLFWKSWSIIDNIIVSNVVWYLLGILVIDRIKVGDSWGMAQ